MCATILPPPKRTERINMMSKDSQPKYEGKAKQLFEASEPGHYIMRFKDAATAFNNKKKATIEGKGLLNQQISATIFEYLRDHGVKSHYVKTLGDREMLVKAVDIVPIEVVVRNIAAGSLCKRLGIKPKKELKPPLVEFFLKDDDLDDPLLNDDHIYMMGLAEPKDLAEFRRLALEVNVLLQEFFKKLGIILVDYKLEFGKDKDGNILLADEVTPDGCRLWDAKTLEILDKDRFRQGLGGLIEAYEDIWNRIQKKGNA